MLCVLLRDFSLEVSFRLSLRARRSCWIAFSRNVRAITGSDCRSASFFRFTSELPEMDGVAFLGHVEILVSVILARKSFVRTSHP